MKVLVSGGAGFIGQHLVRSLVDTGATVTVIDNLSPQVHGPGAESEVSFPTGVIFIKGDVRDRAAWSKALADQDVVVHLAAETGTGQSMYEVAKYEAVNVGGTALLFDCIVNEKLVNIKKIIVASSRAIYGEGKYLCHRDGAVYPIQRTKEDLKLGQYEPRCPKCGEIARMAATDEVTPCNPTSFYGLTKQIQEQMVLMYARTLGVAAYALRFQNVYGPGQSLQNPYTGILAIFSSLARNSASISVFEDGLESRDFVFVDDAIRATMRCIESPAQWIGALNVGSGVATSVMSVAQEIVSYFGSKSKIHVTGDYRIGDIRHNVADLTNATREIRYEPSWSFRAGLNKFLDWTGLQGLRDFRYAESIMELRTKGMMS